MFQRLFHLGSLVWMVFIWFPFASHAFGRNPATSDDGVKSPPPGCHRVLRGETLWSIAIRHDTSVGEIMELNHMENQKLREGQILKLPGAFNADPALKRHVYIVKEDESLRTILKKLHVSVDELADANPRQNLRHLLAGAKLNVPSHTEYSERTEHPEHKDKEHMEELTARKENRESHIVEYTIHGDETFSSIARHYGVPLNDVLAANPDVKPERLHEGMVVLIPTKGQAPEHPSTRHHETAPASDTDAPAPPKRPIRTFVENTSPKDSQTFSHETSAKRLSSEATHPKQDAYRVEDRSYIVKPGETLDGIAKTFGVSQRKLLDYNNFSQDPKIRPGDEIMIPGRIAATASR